jgi:site-specific DNA-methyltransferase (adenine-specific)
MNQIYFGDNLPILQGMPGESVDLIYIDPPFNTGKTQRRRTIKTIRDAQGDRKGFQGETYRTVEVGTKAYHDAFDSYIDRFLQPRLEEAYRLLQPHGSLYFHIDYREAHYCKILLDRIFGRECFLNEIIWAYDFGGRPRSRWPAKHDNIFFYVKDPQYYVFNTAEIDRERYMAPGLVGPEKAQRGKLPADTWWWPYVGGKCTDTWWQTIVGTNSRERLGYPTQKPVRLIDRIIKASSFPGQTVLDFFAGSGTVGESCLRLKRQFILMDNNQAALEIMAQRFAGARDIQWVGFDPAPYQLPGCASGEVKQTDHPGQQQVYTTEFLHLAAAASFMQEDLEQQNELWKESPFAWLLEFSDRQKDRLGCRLAAAWLESQGQQVEELSNSSSDLLVNGHRIAVRFSTLTAYGKYRFEYIHGQEVDHVLCLGISPAQAHVWVFSQEEALQHARRQRQGGRPRMLINPADPPDWARSRGGALEDGLQVIKGLKKED